MSNLYIKQNGGRHRSTETTPLNYCQNEMYIPGICLNKSKAISTLYLSRLEANSVLEKLSLHVDLSSGLRKNTKIANSSRRNQGFCTKK